LLTFIRIAKAYYALSTFATKAIEKLEEGSKRIIWHTQSGKTALHYYNVKYLTDYFQSKKVIPKFYFIVDRLDLLIQG
jgi:type I restriction enzyme R subunit